MEQQTKKLTINLSGELIAEIKKRARNIYGNRKGGISFLIEMQLRTDFHLGHKDVDEP